MTDVSDANDAGSNKQHIGWKHFLIFVIAPALVAGFFSLAPKLYDEITRPKSILQYSVISGPGLPKGNEFQRIFAVVIANEGKTGLTDVTVRMRDPSGKIESLAVGENILAPQVATGPDGGLVRIPRMLPSERLTISAMTATPNVERGLDVSVRSSEVLGSLMPTATTDERPWLSLLGAAMSALSVAIMSTAIAVRMRSKRMSFVLGRRRSDRSELVSLIAGLSGVVVLDKETALADHELRYVGLADALLIAGLKGDQDIKKRCVAALKAILLIDGIAEGSLIVVRENLAQLGEHLSEEEFAEVRKQASRLSRAELRAKIIKLLSAPREANVQ
ncbi:hypothetical protein FO470_12220 [Starkeya sp. 3C]|uniref:Capsular polysaccharide biosynthesis protein n=1 Tax=Ancylobacter moscoviensis TaxID=2597768 RepID=A0ABY3DR55_9HYPH|nr:hypothetical protein [Ancylobacter moscoviensis]TSJ62308.1 hypothetical protein FO470_12220 [Ancylobacter moscoviensis]